MATALTIARVSLRPLHTRVPLTSRHTFRALHASAITHKAKKPAPAALATDDDGTLFPDSADLFSAPAHQPAPAASPPRRAAPRATSRKLSPEARAAKFEALLAFTAAHIGRRPAAADRAQVRSSAWLQLFGLAASRAQLAGVAALFSTFAEGGRAFTPRHAEAFVRRCEELHCAELALEVFSDRPAYRFDLASPTAARRLLHALHQDAPLASSLALVALYRLYRLPPLAADPVACTLLVSACLRDPSKDARIVADGLVPALKDTLARTPPMPIPAIASAAAHQAFRERAWMRWALLKVERALEGRGDDVAWIRSWRERSGHTEALVSA